MVSKMRMTAAFLAVALCMTVFPVTAFAAGTETEEVVETEGAAFRRFFGDHGDGRRYCGRWRRGG